MGHILDENDELLQFRDGIYGSFKGAKSLGAIPLKEPFKKLAHLYIYILQIHFYYYKWYLS